MLVLLPSVYPVNLSQKSQEKYNQMADTLEAIYMFAAANKKLKFTSQVIKPLKVSQNGTNLLGK
jgi:hypothetical protein